MNQGYVKIYRKTLDSRVFQSEGLLKVWLWCLLSANHKGAWVTVKTGKGTTEVWVDSGQFIFGRKSAGKALKMSPSTVWKRMLKLKNMQNLNIDSNTLYSIITIINWETYQGSLNKGDTEGDSEVTAKEHKQECKEGKEIYIAHNADGKCLLKEGIEEVLQVLNDSRSKMLGRNGLRPITSDKSIIARLKDGCSVQEACRIIVTKAQDPYFIENPKYFHPDTLFRKSHWEKYLDEAELLNKKSKGTGNGWI
ncbi:MAG: conserved phage C-terminal domain-containing protein [Deltaproteobacteria bacterium]|nr:conserved phage C-terminal domain-containing protein [Deltaproteobacteria bacterium]